MCIFRVMQAFICVCIYIAYNASHAHMSTIKPPFRYIYAHPRSKAPINLHTIHPQKQERDYFKPPPPTCHLFNDSQCQSPTNPPVGCPDSSWCVIDICICTCICICI